MTTPQPLAQEVAARAALMAQKTDMRVIGVVENMTSDVFGEGGGARLAAAIGAPLLGTVPLDARLREAGDRGEPLVWADPEAEAARAIIAVAEAIEAGEADLQAAAGSLLNADEVLPRIRGASGSRTPTRRRSPTTSSTASGAASAATAIRASNGSRRCPTSTRRRRRSGSSPSRGSSAGTAAARSAT